MEYSWFTMLCLIQVYSKVIQFYIYIYLIFLDYFSFLFFILFFNFTILYWFCHISTWIHHRYSRVPHPEPSSLQVPSLWVIPVLHHQASSIMHWTWTGDFSYMILYMFQWHSPKSSHPLPLPQSPKDCSIHQFLLCCLIYRVIVTIFLNSIYMC